MVERTQKGFTVAELLLVVAIIGLLAVMVVPAFQRAREEARSLTCMSNQQQIIAAIRMYLEDHDGAFPPKETRPEVQAFLDGCPGGRSWKPRALDHCNRMQHINPYLRLPVILEPYLSDREVWQCPSARRMGGATFIVPDTDWFSYWVSHEGEWGRFGNGLGICHLAWPVGWGGTITDTLAQGQLATQSWSPGAGWVAPGAFVQTIGTTAWLGMTTAEIGSVDSFAVTADGGVHADMTGLARAAYPEICTLECSNQVCGWVEWGVCTWAADCGLYGTAPTDGSFIRNRALRMPYARHRGRFVSGQPPWLSCGSNVGFLDGHVEWIASEMLIERAMSGELSGLAPWGPTADCPHWSGAGTFSEVYPGVPTLY
jgi:prepilin-type N-terminal cleavage/methylation domain-containing protein/prepilin-type processing-associated H-X9-DG protein